MLQELQRKVEEHQTKTHPKELALMVGKECNKLHQESDRVRKQFKEGSLSIDQFVNQYIKSRTSYHESEIIKNKLSAMALKS